MQVVNAARIRSATGGTTTAHLKSVSPLHTNNSDFPPYRHPPTPLLSFVILCQDQELSTYTSSGPSTPPFRKCDMEVQLRLFISKYMLT